MDDELYGDLESTGVAAQNQYLKDQIDIAKKKLSEYLSEIDELKTQLSHLLTEKDQVEKNMVSLYNTAVVEIGRKDKEIAEMRATIISMQTSRT